MLAWLLGRLRGRLWGGLPRLRLRLLLLQLLLSGSCRGTELRWRQRPWLPLLLAPPSRGLLLRGLLMQWPLVLVCQRLLNLLLVLQALILVLLLVLELPRLQVRARLVAVVQQSWLLLGCRCRWHCSSAALQACSG